MTATRQLDSRARRSALCGRIANMSATLSYESIILGRLIQPEQGDMAPDLARYVLSLDFSAPDQERVAALSAGAQSGALSPDEEAELDGYLRVNDLLAILQSKARQSLNR